MKQDVAPELLRDFFKVLGPKPPKEFSNYTVEPEKMISGEIFTIFKFKLSDELIQNLMLSKNMLPMFDTSMEKILLGKMTVSGVDENLKNMIDFVQSLRKFKEKVHSYFTGLRLNVVFEFV
jgi:hypothetical protein